jgi:hypothetical protein
LSPFSDHERGANLDQPDDDRNNDQNNSTDFGIAGAGDVERTESHLDGIVGSCSHWGSFIAWGSLSPSSFEKDCARAPHLYATLKSARTGELDLKPRLFRGLSRFKTGSFPLFQLKTRDNFETSNLPIGVGIDDLIPLNVGATGDFSAPVADRFGAAGFPGVSLSYAGALTFAGIVYASLSYDALHGIGDVVSIPRQSRGL